MQLQVIGFTKFSAGTSEEIGASNWYCRNKGRRGIVTLNWNVRTGSLK